MLPIARATTLCTAWLTTPSTPPTFARLSWGGWQLAQAALIPSRYRVAPAGALPSWWPRSTRAWAAQHTALASWVLPPARWWSHPPGLLQSPARPQYLTRPPTRQTSRPLTRTPLLTQQCPRLPPPTRLRPAP